MFLKIAILFIALYIFWNLGIHRYLKRWFKKSYTGVIVRPSNMEVNAAICELINGNVSTELMSVIVRFGHHLPERGPFYIVGTTPKKNDGTIISGHTQEQGNINIKTSDDGQEKEWAYGIHKERVGYFRIYKNNWGAIEFHHFWKSGVTTASESEEPAKYRLEYDEKTLEPLCFGIYGYHDFFVLNIPSLKISLREDRLAIIPDNGQSKHLTYYLYMIVQT